MTHVNGDEIEWADSLSRQSIPQLMESGWKAHNRYCFILNYIIRPEGFEVFPSRVGSVIPERLLEIQELLRAGS